MQKFDFTKLEEGDQITDDYGTYAFTRKMKCKETLSRCKGCDYSKRIEYFSICHLPCEDGVWKEVIDGNK